MRTITTKLTKNHKGNIFSGKVKIKHSGKAGIIFNHKGRVSSRYLQHVAEKCGLKSANELTDELFNQHVHDNCEVYTRILLTCMFKSKKTN